MSYFRDEELGQTLRELEVPAHRPGFDEELVRRLTAVPRQRLPLLPAAALALAISLVAAIVLFAPTGGTDVASAADLRDRVLDAAWSASTISGIFVNREQPTSGRENRWQFTVAESGSFRIAALDSPSVLAYDATANVESNSDEGLFVTRVGLAPSPPDAAAAGWVLQRGLGSVVAALAVDGDADVTEIEYQRRAAWQVRLPTGNRGETRLIVVDRETGIPVRSTLFRNGHAGAEWRIEQLRVDDPTSADTFTLTPSDGQTRTRYDMGFRRVALEDVSSRVGYRPLVPTRIPDGFERVEVAVAEQSRPTGDEQRPNPPSRDVVSLRYRNGLDELVVTTRRVGADPSAWGDPLIGSAPMGRAPEQVTFRDGALEGHTGEVVVDANSVPHVWAVAGALVVTVAGNLDRDELVRVAESLKPAG